MIAAGPGPRAPQTVLPAAPQALSSARLYARLAASGVTAPVAMANAGDGSARIFVVQKAGVISVVKNGVTLGTPFLDIQTLVNSTGGEQGLLGLAFHPNYAVNGQFYTVYTDAAGSLTLSRFLVSAGNPDVADPTSQSVLLTIPHPECTNHNGGQLAFGPDGFLYWSTGDGAGTTGACGGDPLNNAQNTNVLLGKILRLDVDHTDPGLNYAIPSTNPFFSVTGSRGEIWDYGLRNAWRFSFDRLTHDIYIGDVGQNLLEEVDFEPAGGPGGVNYGWRVMEGTSCFNESNFNQPLASCNTSGKQLPVTEYDHSSGRCAITGGYVYRGGLYYLLQGHYFYGDFCNGQIFDLYHDASAGWISTPLIDTPYSISTFGQDEQGEIYLGNYAAGTIYRLQYVQSPYTDFNANGSTDLAVYRPSSGAWLIQGQTGSTWGGLTGDIPVAGDYNGDGQTDVAIYRPSTGVWYVKNQFNSAWGGAAGDVPMQGDYNGDGKTDVAIFRPSTGTWYVKGLFNSAWGSSGDIPVPGDYNGDGKTDVAIFRPSTGTWYVKGLFNASWGTAGDIPVPGDYNGDGKTDLAVFRPSTGTWYVKGLFNSVWGTSGDIPVPGDYDANGATDVAVFRPSTGTWFIQNQVNTLWGMSGDFPIPARDTNGDGTPYQ